MKRSGYAVFFIFILFSMMYGNDGPKKINFGDNSFFHNISINREMHQIIMTHNETKRKIIITEDADLYVDGNFIKLTTNERQMCRNFYMKMSAFLIQVQDIAQRGVKLGAKGATLGLSTLFKTIKLISPTYDSENLEKEIGKKAEKIEREANKLENEANQLEEQADKIGELWERMQQSIPEIKDMDWIN